MKNLNRLKSGSPRSLPKLPDKMYPPKLEERLKKLESPGTAIWHGKLERVRNKFKK